MGVCELCNRTCVMGDASRSSSGAVEVGSASPGRGVLALTPAPVLVLVAGPPCAAGFASGFFAPSGTAWHSQRPCTDHTLQEERKQETKKAGRERGRGRSAYAAWQARWQKEGNNKKEGGRERGGGRSASAAHQAGWHAAKHERKWREQAQRSHEQQLCFWHILCHRHSAPGQMEFQIEEGHDLRLCSRQARTLRQEPS